MTAETRLTTMGAAIDARATVDPDQLGAAWLDFAENGILSDDADLRNAVIDFEEAAFLAAGGDPDGDWLVTLDAARTTPADQYVEVRRAVLEGECVTARMRLARRGKAALAT